MAYLGRQPAIGRYTKLDNIASSFNGSTTTFNLTSGSEAQVVQSETQILVSLNGVLQEPQTAYTVSGSQITFTSAPANGVTFFGTLLGDTFNVGIPSDNTLQNRHIKSDAAIAMSKLDGSSGTLSALTVSGAVSKGSGSFLIEHPLDSKKDTHNLAHSFVEGPQADLIYRGRVALSSGAATVNIDTAAGMTSGTFEALNGDVQCFTSNETGWTAVKGSVSGATLTIQAQDNSCTDTISWMVVGERKDKHMFDTDWTDDNGKVIVEPLKPEEVTP
jgi:hypothetical protein